MGVWNQVTFSSCTMLHLGWYLFLKSLMPQYKSLACNFHFTCLLRKQIYYETSLFLINNDLHFSLHDMSETSSLRLIFCRLRPNCRGNACRHSYFWSDSDKIWKLSSMLKEIHARRAIQMSQRTWVLWTSLCEPRRSNGAIILTLPFQFGQISARENWFSV